MVGLAQSAKLIEALVKKTVVHVKDLDLLGGPKASGKFMADDKAVIDKALKKHGGTYSDSTDKSHIFEFQTKESAQKFYNDTKKTPHNTLFSDLIE